nr:HAMP domain-containing sensor histidine kinase [Jiangella mangrovi]
MVAGLALLLGGVALVLVMRSVLLEQVTDAARARAATVAAADPHLIADDDGFAQVIDTGGRVVAATPNVAGADAVDLRPGDTAHVDIVPGEDMLAVAVAAGDRTVVAGQSTDDVGEATAVVTRLLGVGLPVLLAVVAVTTWWAAGRALAPVEAVREEVDAISAAELHRRVPDAGHDEIARLARTMNRMLDRLEHAQTRQREFVSDASHELRSPVASIRQHAEVALAHPGRTTVPDLAATVLAEDLRVQRLVEDLLLLARADEHRLRLASAPVDVDDLVLEEAARLRSGGSGLRIDTTGIAAARVTGDAGALRRVLRNLGDNAARHAAGVVGLSVAARDGAVVVTVEDDGPGIAVEDRDRVLRRFVRLDEARDRDAGGAGLGLAIVDELVRAHGGTVEVGSSSIGGARVVVRLPAG